MHRKEFVNRFIYIRKSGYYQTTYEIRFRSHGYNFSCTAKTIELLKAEFSQKTRPGELEKYKTAPGKRNKRRKDMVKVLLKYQDTFAKENVALNMLEREKRQYETALENIMRAIEQGIINNMTNKRMKELEDKMQDLDRKLIIEKSKVSVKATEDDIREFFAQGITLEAKLMISYLIKEIRLFDDKVEIQFNSPILKSPDNSQGFLLYTGFRKMPYLIFNKPQPKLKTVKVEIYI